MTLNSKTLHKKEIFQIRKAVDPSKLAIRLLQDLPRESNSPGTVYTTIRTYCRLGGIAHYLFLEKHIQRLNDSLEINGSSIRVDGSRIKQAVALLDQNTSIRGDLRIKIIIIPECEEVYTFIVEPLTTPGLTEYTNGAQVYTHRYVRNKPEAKTFGFVNVQNQIRAETDKDAEEILMLGEKDELLEGLSSNFFAIKRNRLRTAGKGVLRGITRQIVLDLAMKHGLQVDYTPVEFQDIGQIDEAFITSTSRGILPVVGIDQNVIGSGIPGPITKKLMIWFDSEIMDLIQPL